MKPEAHEQKMLLKWWLLAHRGLGVPDSRLLFAVPNGAFLGGGKMGARRGARLKGEGLVCGVPDLFLAIPRERYAEGKLRNISHGLFIEMKRANGGTVSDAQKDMTELFISQGYNISICHGWQAGMIAITNYVNGETVNVLNVFRKQK